MTTLEMTSILMSHTRTCFLGVGENQLLPKGRFSQIPCIRYYYSSYHLDSSQRRRTRHLWTVSAGKLEDGMDGSDDSQESEQESVNDEILREKLERIVGADDSSFSGMDLATLIRNKYGRSYDVQLIKKEFMGRNLLALNVMWKYMEQRSFPLTEEEYILRLDDVANTLKCWGAVSHVRNSLQKLKERPRIGKAVSIFIDMDESGGRANEWIYK